MVDKLVKEAEGTKEDKARNDLKQKLILVEPDTQKSLIKGASRNH